MQVTNMYVNIWSLKIVTSFLGILSILHILTWYHMLHVPNIYIIHLFIVFSDQNSAVHKVCSQSAFVSSLFFRYVGWATVAEGNYGWTLCIVEVCLITSWWPLSGQKAIVNVFKIKIISFEMNVFLWCFLHLLRMRNMLL
jgi:hypothetical protein